MDSIVNVGTFVKYLTEYLKLGIYINKGTDNDVLLEKCIKIYNKYKSIEVSTEPTEEDEIVIRRCFKRLNLILKVDNNGKPINVRDKENQLKMVYLQEHPSLSSNNMKSMLSFATKNSINILTDVPLMFMLRESKYQTLIWQYTRCLFYISQLLITKTDPGADDRDKTVALKRKIFDDSANKLENILVLISELEEHIKVNQVMAVDHFLNSKLIKTGITKDKVNDARNEVKEIFAKKGIGMDNSMMSMIDSISEKLTSVDLTQGNIIESMFGIAQNVAQEMRGELESNPEKFQSAFGAITEVFQEAMDESSNNGQEVPAELKSMFGSLLSATSMDGSNNQMNDEDISKHLENIVSANGLNREEFYNSIQGENGQVDINRLEKYLSGMNK